MLDPEVLSKSIGLKEEGPRSFTQVPKVGSATRCSNELLIEEFFKEAPNYIPILYLMPFIPLGYPNMYTQGSY
jgi:hypothetical protein